MDLGTHKRTERSVTDLRALYNRNECILCTQHENAYHESVYARPEKNKHIPYVKIMFLFCTVFFITDTKL